MKTLLLTAVAVLLLLLAGASFGDVYRVTYTHAGLIKRVTVQAESPAEARRTVQDIFPGCYVTNALRVRR